VYEIAINKIKLFNLISLERSLILEFYPLVVRNIISNALWVSNGDPRCPEDDRTTLIEKIA